MKKTKKRATKELDIGSIVTQTSLLKELVLAKATILERRKAVKWKDKWSKETHGQELYKLEPKLKSNIVKLYIGLSKELGLLVIQIQTRKIGLGQFFFEQKVFGIEDGRCEYKQGDQTVKYVLWNCR